MLRLATERDELRVVDDQVGTPTCTGDIVTAMQTLINKDASGVYHFTNEGVASWYDFAEEIVTRSRQLGLPVKAKQVIPIPSAAYPTPAKRPAYSVLSKEKIRSVLDSPIPHWRESLEMLLRAIQERASRPRKDNTA